MSRIVPDEEIIRASEVQSDYAKVFDRAADHPVSVPRGQGKEDVTVVSRRAWLRAARSLQFQAWLSQLAVVLSRRLAGKEAPFPSELSWLSAFENADVADFVVELAETLSAISDGVRELSDLHDLLYQWHRSAQVLRDPELRRRMSDARPLIA